MTRDACIDLARAAGRPVDDVLEWWGERAAIREFEGGQPRATAEVDALGDVRAWLGAGRLGPRSAPAQAAASKRDTK
jgi:hypothetical protein